MIQMPVVFPVHAGEAQSIRPNTGSAAPMGHSHALPAEPLWFPAHAEDVPSCSIRPFTAAGLCDPVPGGMQAMASSRITSPGCPLHLLCCLNRPGLTGSAGYPGHLGFTGALPAWDLHSSGEEGVGLLFSQCMAHGGLFVEDEEEQHHQDRKAHV